VVEILVDIHFQAHERLRFARLEPPFLDLAEMVLVFLVRQLELYARFGARTRGARSERRRTLSPNPGSFLRRERRQPSVKDVIGGCCAGRNSAAAALAARNLRTSSGSGASFTRSSKALEDHVGDGARRVALVLHAEVAAIRRARARGSDVGVLPRGREADDPGADLRMWCLHRMHMAGSPLTHWKVMMKPFMRRVLAMNLRPQA
jgi:hypothetical protein